MRKGEDTTYYLLGHLKRLLIGGGFFLLGLVVPTKILKKAILPSLVIIFPLLVITLIAGKVQFGAKRSLVISSFGIQISEFVRVWIIFFLANFFATHQEIAQTNKGILSALGICLLLIVLIAFQPSVSMAVICFLILGAMLIYSGANLKILSSTAFVGLCLTSGAILIFPHARMRIIGYLSHPAYQVQQSLIAIGSGGILGKGLGAGLQKFLFLPDIHKDFIFAHIAEEMGLIGTLIVFFLYCQVFLRGIAIAGSVETKFDKLLVLGLNASIFMIFLIHVGVSLGLLPPAGIPLPFISFGGWSLSVNLFAMGIILQVSKRRVV
jgi:cell division protein FtsW